MAQRNMVTCVYVTDERKEMLKRIDARYVAQMTGADPPAPVLGAIVATRAQLRTLVNAPRDLSPRTIQLATADGLFHGRIPVFTPDAYLVIAMGDPFNFFDGEGVSHAGTVEGKQGERQRHKADVT